MTWYLYRSRQSGLNRRPADYKSAALPTELYRRDFLQILRLQGLTKSGNSISAGRKGPLYPLIVSPSQTRVLLRVKRHTNTSLQSSRENEPIQGDRSIEIRRASTIAPAHAQPVPKFLKSWSAPSHVSECRFSLGNDDGSEPHAVPAFGDLFCSIQGRRQVDSTEPRYDGVLGSQATATG